MSKQLADATKPKPKARPKAKQRAKPAFAKRPARSETRRRIAVAVPEGTRTVAVQFPIKLRFLFQPMRYKVAYGGRGGAKSWGFARALITIGVARPIRVLCAREFQNSITESVHKLLSLQIEALGVAPFFTITQTGIRGANGTEFIFSGIRNNVTKIKSMEGIDIVWVEEAEKVSDESWMVLIPTIRKPNSEIWVSFNAHQESDPTYKRFVLEPPDDCIVVKINWRDNPWLPIELIKEKDYLARVDPDAYAHVWEGECRNLSDAQVLRNKYVIEGFTPVEGKWEGPYFGADWGFAQDPTVLVKMWIYERRLYVEYEAYGVGVDIDETPELFDSVPGGRKAVIRADSARPETISFMQRHGYPNMKSVLKWPGSVEDGVTFMRSFEIIVIHPRCIHVGQEARLYSYKTDRLSGDVLPIIIDANNHGMDAIRYGLQPLVKRVGNAGLLDLAASDMSAKREAEAKAEAGKGETKNTTGEVAKPWTMAAIASTRNKNE